MKVIFLPFKVKFFFAVVCSQEVMCALGFPSKEFFKAEDKVRASIVRTSLIKLRQSMS